MCRGDRGIEMESVKEKLRNSERGLRNVVGSGNLLDRARIVPLAYPVNWNVPMLNRSAVVIIPKKPFLDWVNAVDDLGTVTADDMQGMIYLVPDYEDPADADKVLKKVCNDIFCRELEGWHTDEEAWPQDRSFKVFKQWFDIQHYEIVTDVGRGPIENDDQD